MKLGLSIATSAVPRTAVIVIGLLWAIAWFLPAIDTGPGLEGSSEREVLIPGWQAFRAAIDPLFSGEHEEGSYVWETLSVLSALTNGLFLAALIRFLARPHSSTKRWFWALLCAAGINTFWMIDADVPDGLRAGYYMWFGSFVLLAIVAVVGTTELRAPRPQPAS